MGVLEIGDLIGIIIEGLQDTKIARLVGIINKILKFDPERYLGSKLRKMIMNRLNIVNKLVHKQEEFKKLLEEGRKNKINAKDGEYLKKQMNKSSRLVSQNLGNEDYSTLPFDTYKSINSSGIKVASFHPYSRSTTGWGMLTIITQSATGKSYGPYTYPFVPINVWKEMLNVSNAGTIFWRDFLRYGTRSYARSIIKSSLREYGVFNGLKTDNINKNLFNAREIFEIRNLVNKSISDFRNVHRRLFPEKESYFSKAYELGLSKRTFIDNRLEKQRQTALYAKANALSVGYKNLATQQYEQYKGMKAYNKKIKTYGKIAKNTYKTFKNPAWVVKKPIRKAKKAIKGYINELKSR